VVEFAKFNTAFFFYQRMKLEFTEPRVPMKDLSERELVTADLQHRDFTINAISAPLIQDRELELFDPTAGITDLRARVLRTPMSPVQTFREDPVRILRAFRFSARYNLKVEPEIIEAMKATVGELERISGERIGEELWKILELPLPSKALKPLYNVGGLKKILPELVRLAIVEQRGKFNHKDIFLHSLRVLDNVAVAGGDTVTRFAALVHDIAKPLTKKFHPQEGFTFHGHEDLGAGMVETIGRRLRLSSDKIKLAKKLTFLHMRPVNLVGTEVTDSAIRRLMAHAGEDLERLLTLCRADITSGNPQKVKLYVANFDLMVERMQEVEDKDKMRAFQSPVRGDEIMQICSIPESVLVGKIKKAIEKAILDGVITNEYEAAKKYFVEHKEQWLRGEFE
jgi:tRNA nucleotidyltransferase/poly(A) polymerase